MNMLKIYYYKLIYKLHRLYSKGHDKDLSKLGEIFNTDKVGSHFYTTHYSSHFSQFKDKQVNVLEIGVGGYEKNYKGGNSLRMWKEYFSNGKIYAIDIYDKSSLEENRIKIFKGSQTDRHFLLNVVNEIGEIDLIIDDGSHINEHVIQSFEILFPLLKDGGIYVVEDVQTSYWEDFGGDSNNMNNPKTIMNYFKSLTDSLNNKEFLILNYKQTYYDRKITSIHFYHNMIFIYKGDNNDESNIVVNNQRTTHNTI